MDREKVIKGLETIKQFFGYGLPTTAELFDSYYGILNDAIALLKEQEQKLEKLEAQFNTMKQECSQIERTKKTFWDSMSEADLFEPMHHFQD